MQTTTNATDTEFTEHDFTAETRQERVPCLAGKRHHWEPNNAYQAANGGDRRFNCAHCGRFIYVTTPRPRAFSLATFQRTTTTEREEYAQRPLVVRAIPDEQEWRYGARGGRTWDDAALSKKAVNYCLVLEGFESEVAAHA